MKGLGDAAGNFRKPGTKRSAIIQEPKQALGLFGVLRGFQFPDLVQVFLRDCDFAFGDNNSGKFDAPCSRN